MQEYRIIKSQRKTISIEISKLGEVTVRAPLFCPKWRINAFIKQKQNWIEKTLKRFKSQTIGSRPLTQDEISQLRKLAKEVIPKKVKYFSDLMNVNYNNLKITSAKKRFGSCSTKNTLCFSLYLMQFGQPLIDYVVVHELAHTIHHNHSKEFYGVIEKYLPDYKERQKALRDRAYPIDHKKLED